MIRLLVKITWMLLGWLELGLLTALLYPLSFLPARPHPRPWYARLFRLWSQAWVHALGVDLRLHQRNRRPLPERYILIANHPSAFEDIGIPALFPVRSLAKVEVRDWWIVGRVSAAAGTLYVDRESPESRRAAVDLLVDTLEAGDNLALYPEGGVKGKHLHDRFRYGAFEVSLRTGIPILPVYLHYEAGDDFFWGPQILIEKILDIMRTRNNRANYYVYDAFQPADYADAVEYAEAAHARFLEWEERHQG